MTDRMWIAVCASLFFVGPAFAQQPAPRVGELQPSAQMPQFRATDLSSQQRSDAMVRVQSTVSYFIPGPTNDSEEAQKLRDRARCQIYDAAARECDVLRDTLAKDCRLESVTSNTNVNRSYGPNQQDGFTINGSMSYQITLK